MTKPYQKPAVSTIEIPERTAYACNLHTRGRFGGCPQTSNLSGHTPRGKGRHRREFDDD